MGYFFINLPLWGRAAILWTVFSQTCVTNVTNVIVVYLNGLKQHFYFYLFLFLQYIDFNIIVLLSCNSSRDWLKLLALAPPSPCLGPLWETLSGWSYSAWCCPILQIWPIVSPLTASLAEMSVFSWNWSPNHITKEHLYLVLSVGL